MALHDLPYVPRDGTLTIQDNTGPAIILTVTYEDGDFKIGPLKEAHWETQVFKDRGIPYSIRETEKNPVPFSFSCHATQLGHATDKTLPDAIMKSGAFGAGVSTKGANYPVWLVKCIWTGERTNYGYAADSTYTLNHCRLEYSFSEGAPGKFEISGIAIPFADADVAHAT